MAKHRSERLLKKLHLGPYQQLGFALTLKVKPEVTAAQAEVFLADFLSHCIEANGLVFGGGMDCGWVDADGRGSASEAHRQLVGDWLLARPELDTVVIGQLCDAWYGPFDLGEA
ncbi:YggL family protein [Chitinimonas sp. BJYL2]|uniref:YggL 50S ribosome-binding family protein n=1 Tax=Chitinimonas sp. BJYL2 TaxID=2976696 RepID=UPI0022B413CB|nr:50S ribosome-binding protein YggL [Chitinimonas sp. BJYL2]